MDAKKTIIGAVFVIVGISLIAYAFSRPCEVGAITQTVGEQTSVVEQPEKMNRMICMSTDAVALICTLLGAASIFPGVGGLFKGLTEK
ncbi:hypothetical protein KY332_04925 [Candidatus Woesearchaeota archaeon]|nr:hypothetical protein [Candidatus Woesearchaeota archaeon]